MAVCVTQRLLKPALITRLNLLHEPTLIPLLPLQHTNLSTLPLLSLFSILKITLINTTSHIITNFRQIVLKHQLLKLVLRYHGNHLTQVLFYLGGSFYELLIFYLQVFTLIWGFVKRQVQLVLMDRRLSFPQVGVVVIIVICTPLHPHNAILVSQQLLSLLLVDNVVIGQLPLLSILSHPLIPIQQLVRLLPLNVRFDRVNLVIWINRLISSLVLINSKLVLLLIP